MTKKVYDNAVNVLLDAYNGGLLFHESCYACAVGNLVASAKDFKISNKEMIFIWKDSDNKRVTAEWYSLMKYKGYMNKEDIALGMIEINSTGMTLPELTIIEKSFESIEIEGNYSTKQEQYLGLCAVLDVMKDMVEDEVPHVDNLERLEVIYEQFETVKA